MPTAPAVLIKPRDEVRAQLTSRIQKGEVIAATPIGTESRLAAIMSEYDNWNDYNIEYLRRSFSAPDFEKEYSSTSGIVMIPFGRPPLHVEVNSFLNKIANKIRILKSIAERLDLVDEILPDPPAGCIEHKSVDIHRVFIVHGRDNESKEIVCRFLENCGLTPIVLHDMPNGGQTIIEKFETVSDVGFAVVILTPDDLGCLESDYKHDRNSLMLRARQNVVLELGYFVGKLGRRKVCALNKGDIEIPSDISGVVWTPFGADEGWKIGLARELSAAGYEINLSKALRI